MGRGWAPISAHWSPKCPPASSDRSHRRSEVPTHRRTAHRRRPVEPGSQLGAFLIALDEQADYANANFAFFRARRKRFVYIDRVITAKHAMRQGLASKLYEDLFLRATAAAQSVVGCEVNLLPPNPASDAFHPRMGFVEVGTAQLPNGKTVRYLERTLDHG